MTVTQLERSMGSDELGRWMAYAQIEPFGPSVEAAQQARIGWILVNTVRSIFSAEPLSVSEFLLTKPAPPEPMTSAQHKAALDSNPFFKKVE